MTADAGGEATPDKPDTRSGSQTAASMRATEPSSSANGDTEDELTDELPDDLQPSEFEGEYEFPDNSRRRIQGAIYLAAAGMCVWIGSRGESTPIVNAGWWWVAIGLAIFGLIAIATGQRMQLDERAALVRAQQAVGFPVGYASAQQVWHGVTSRPTWRVLVYSTEDVPSRRGLVLVDAIDGKVLQELVQPADPSEWSD